MMSKVFIVCLMAVGVLAMFDVMDLMKETIRREAAKVCEKNNATDKTEDFVNAVTSAEDCVKGLLNPETITQEINEAKTTQSNLKQEVIKKYCGKIPDLKVCLNNLSDGVKPCLSEENPGSIATARKIIDSFLDFICYKDGDRITMFIDEDGPKCLKDKREKMKECRSYAQKTVTQKKSFEEQCNKFDELTSCVVKALEECSSPTPAKMMEELFKYMRKSAPCPKKAE